MLCTRQVRFCSGNTSCIVILHIIIVVIRYIITCYYFVVVIFLEKAPFRHTIFLDTSLKTASKLFHFIIMYYGYIVYYITQQTVFTVTMLINNQVKLFVISPLTNDDSNYSFLHLLCSFVFLLNRVLIVIELTVSI